MTIQVLKPNSLIPIQVSNEFYDRVKILATYLTNSVTEEELNITIDNIKNDKELSEFGFCFETVLILLKELDNQAINNDLVETKDVS